MIKKMNILEGAITDYLLWLRSRGYADSTLIRYETILKHFLFYTSDRKIPWDRMFTVDTENQFKKDKGITCITTVLRAFSKYLYILNKIPRPIKDLTTSLPKLYEEYLIYYKDTKQVHKANIQKCRKTLSAFNDYLKIHKINLVNLKIEHADDFLADHCTHLSPGARQNKRSYIRNFLSYLFHNRKVINRNLASFIVGGPQFAEKIPPKFLRMHEIQKLFDGLDTESPRGLRTNAIIYLAYTLGLRPKEISLITLDDIFFSKNEISIPCRKSNNPVRLPLPENTIKSIAAYIIGGRPKSTQRILFLKTRAPYSPISPGAISSSVLRCMIKSNLPSSAYWLRHTYAQNLLEQGGSIFEIKQMMGHDRIQTTKRYIKIYPELMRKVLFDETL